MKNPREHGLRGHGTRFTARHRFRPGLLEGLGGLGSATETEADQTQTTQAGDGQRGRLGN